MTEEFLLTPTDVAEAIGGDVHEVLHLIESGALPATHIRGWKIHHDDLSVFIALRQHAALQLGEDSVAVPSFAVLRPVQRQRQD